MENACSNVPPAQAWGGPFPGSPPLDAGPYARCFGMRLDGFLAPPPPPDIAWSSAAHDAATAGRTRVCIRFSGHAAVTLGGLALTCAAPGNYDATLVCHDLDALPGGMVPLSVEFGSDPRDASNVLQMWVIPVARAWQARRPPPAPACAAARPAAAARLGWCAAARRRQRCHARAAPARTPTPPRSCDAAPHTLLCCGLRISRRVLPRRLARTCGAGAEHAQLVTVARLWPRAAGGRSSPGRGRLGLRVRLQLLRAHERQQRRLLPAAGRMRVPHARLRSAAEPRCCPASTPASARLCGGSRAGRRAAAQLAAAQSAAAQSAAACGEPAAAQPAAACIPSRPAAGLRHAAAVAHSGGGCQRARPQGAARRTCPCSAPGGACDGCAGGHARGGARADMAARRCEGHSGDWRQVRAALPACLVLHTLHMERTCVGPAQCHDVRARPACHEAGGWARRAAVRAGATAASLRCKWHTRRGPTRA